MKIVFLDAHTLGSDISLAPIAACGELVCYDHTSDEQVFERITDCEVLIVNKIQIRKAQIDAAPKLKLICVAATGVNNIDLDYAALKGIPVKNAVDYSTNSVTQVTFSILLSLAGQISHFDNWVKSGSYSKSRSFTHLSKVFWELKGKRYGVIGLGNIGTNVARIAKAFGMEVYYYPTSGKAHSSEFPALSLEELLSTCDVVSVHAPLNDRTKNLVTYEKLQLMKKSAYILNMGRGGIINEADLVKALNDNLIAGAGVDVYTCEPLPETSPYFNIEDKSKIIFTPHIGWASAEARVILVEKIARNIEEYAAKH